MTDLILAGDIGGTKAHLLLVEPNGDPRHPRYEARLATQGVTSLEEILRRFLHEAQARPRLVSLGIPGPVIGGRVKPVNLPWEAEQHAIAAACGAEHALFMNDLVATALGIPQLRPDELLPLAPGQPRADGPVGVLAPGTGLGLGWLTREGGRWRAHPSEGGNADFSPRGPRQRAVHAAIEAEYGQVPTEFLACGLGLPIMWRAMGTTGLRDAVATEAAIQAAADPSPVIMAAAVDPVANPRCAAVAEDLALILAQEASNMALRWIATGGVYLAGGVTPRILPWLKNPAVVAAFRRNRAHAALLSQIPLTAVLNPGTAVLGAWAAAQDLA